MTRFLTKLRRKYHNFTYTHITSKTTIKAYNIILIISVLSKLPKFMMLNK